MPSDQDLFEQLIALPAAERGTVLERECAGDLDQRRRLLELLRAHDDVGGFLEPPAREIPVGAAASSTNPIEERPGDRIGRYKLLQKIGEGGCGVVYMAEQEAPVRRRVALKVIKLGMDTKAVVARFEAERQALALMDHPNIAHVFDGGATDRGRPYFVMELVRGIRITDYCDQNRVPTRVRLELFIQVCSAVQHAHQKGIIHRDLKPSNIMVTLHDGEPVPKVIDFGIAKATQGRLTESTLFTEFEQFIGTPSYMSPEQAEMSGLDIDTRSDVYSLGVLLYELLTGQPPFDGKALAKAGIDSLRRTIREVDPPKPSTRVSTMTGENLATVARQRGTGSVQLSSLLRGDLDWIVMKALEKNRTRRYETVNGLAADLRRYLNHEPIVARPPSTGYRLGKLIRRNRITAISALVIVVLLLGGIASTAIQARRALQAEQENVAQSLNTNGLLQSAAGNFDAAEAALLEASRMRASGSALPYAETLSNLGWVQLQLGHPDEAEQTLLRAREIQGRSGEDREDLALTLKRIGFVRVQQDRLAEAETELREALRMNEDVLGENHLEVASAMNFLGVALALQEDDASKFTEALNLYISAREIRDKLSASVEGQSAGNLNTLLTRQGTPAEIEELLRFVRSYGQTRQVDARKQAYYEALITVVLLEEGKFAEAEVSAQKCFELRSGLDPEHWGTFHAQEMLGEAIAGQGRLNEAVVLLLAGYQGMKARETEIPYPHRIWLGKGLQSLANVYAGMDRPANSARWGAELQAWAAAHPDLVRAISR